MRDITDDLRAILAVLDSPGSTKKRGSAGHIGPSISIVCELALMFVN
jgi:hypothetical protein